MIRRIARFTVVLLVFWLKAPVFAQDFKWVDSPPKKKVITFDLKKELSEKVVIEKCQEFLKRTKLDGINSLVQISRYMLDRPLWMLNTNEYRIIIDSYTGEVHSLFGLSAKIEENKKLRREHGSQILSKMEARVLSNRMAERFSLGKTFEATEIIERYDDDKQFIGYRIIYDQTQFGYGFYDHEGCVMLTVDPLGDLIVDYTNYASEVEIVSHIAKLKEGNAIEIADKVALKNGLNQPPDAISQRQPPSQNELGYIYKSRCFGSSIDKGVKRKYYLAWVIKYPYGDTVWIDAGNGKVIGGSYKTRKGHPRFGEGLDN